jgi:dTMP kinase
MRGLFIVFEGGDSTGKSTQAKWLAASLAQAGIEHLVTFEPGATWLGAHMRSLVLSRDSGNISARTETLLYLADKAQHVAELIEPALAAGKVVVSDRYVDSAIAYQGSGRELSTSEVEQIARWATNDLHPDLTVLLDADPEAAVETIKDGEKDRLESAGLDLHARARIEFLGLASRDPEKYLVIPALSGRAEIAAQVRGKLAELGLVLEEPASLAAKAPRSEG